MHFHVFRFASQNADSRAEARRRRGAEVLRSMSPALTPNGAGVGAWCWVSGQRPKTNDQRRSICCQRPSTRFQLPQRRSLEPAAGDRPDVETFETWPTSETLQQGAQGTQQSPVTRPPSPARRPFHVSRFSFHKGPPSPAIPGSRRPIKVINIRKCGYAFPRFSFRLTKR